MDTINSVQQDVAKAASLEEVYAILNASSISQEEKAAILEQASPRPPKAELTSTPGGLAAATPTSPAPEAETPSFWNRLLGAASNVMSPGGRPVTSGEGFTPGPVTDFASRFVQTAANMATPGRPTTSPAPAPTPEAAPAPAPQAAQPAAPAPGVPSSRTQAEKEAIKATTPKNPQAAKQKGAVVEDLTGKVKGDPVLPPPVKDAFVVRLTELQNQLKEVSKEYSKKWDDAQKDFTDAQSRAEWQSLAESFGNAFVQLGAAYYGLQQTKASGMPINLSNLNLKVTDWDKKVDRALSELQQKRIAIGESQKEAISGITTEMGEVGRTQREAMQQAGQDARSKEDRLQRAADAKANRTLQLDLAKENNRIKKLAIDARNAANQGKLSPQEYKRLADFNSDYMNFIKDVAAGKISEDGMETTVAALLTRAGMPQEEITQVVEDTRGFWNDTPQDLIPILHAAAARLQSQFGGFPLVSSAEPLEDAAALPDL
jgi:hypothetical protein